MKFIKHYIVVFYKDIDPITYAVINDKYRLIIHDEITVTYNGDSVNVQTNQPIRTDKPIRLFKVCLFKLDKDECITEKTFIRKNPLHEYSKDRFLRFMLPGDKLNIQSPLHF